MLKHHMLSGHRHYESLCNGFEITSMWEKHVVEDNVLFTNHLAGKWEILADVVECYPYI